MAMTIVETTRPVTGGVDTHLDVHVAAAVDASGGVLGVESFATTPTGFAELHDWLVAFGPLRRVGVEGTGAYGAGLARHLRALGLEVIEVDRPNRQLRRRAGKSDTIDAIEAARAALSGRAAGIAKTADGNVEGIRTLLIAKRSARDTRIKCLNQIRHLGFTAPMTCENDSAVCRAVVWHAPPPRCGRRRRPTRSGTRRSSRSRR
jgi:transposase